MTLAFVPWDQLFRWMAANPGYVVVLDLGHHSRRSVLVEKRS